MKFSFRQLLASAGGAVIAAVIASLFGVKGTIVGVAIGSAAATFGTALVAQSIERGHQAVKQVVVRVPESSTLLRRLGGTGAAGVAQSTPEAASTLTEETTTSAAQPNGTVGYEASAHAEAPVTEATPTTQPTPTTQSTPITQPTPATEQVTGSPGPDVPSRGFRWPAVAGAVAGVFVLALLFVTAVELIAGEPLADLFGAHAKGNAPSIIKVFQTPTTTLPKPTTTTSTSTSTTTSTSSTSTTTSTTTVGETTTSSATGSSSTSSTTTTSAPSTSSTTTPSG